MADESAEPHSFLEEALELRQQLVQACRYWVAAVEEKREMEQKLKAEREGIYKARMEAFEWGRQDALKKLGLDPQPQASQGKPKNAQDAPRRV